MQKIKKADKVIIIAGKDKGKRGTVTRILSGGEKLIVEGVNVIKKHVKPNPNIGEVFLKKKQLYIVLMFHC
jgi:large subunit ribosomal protein L24